MQEQTELQEPQGIGFFNVKSGETHYAKLEPTIAAYINSSDLGINASRGQDQGWKLNVEWVRRVKAFRRDPMQMQILQSRNGGQKPTTIQILYYLYGQELAAFQEDLEENEAPFAEQYQRDIATGANQNAAPTVATSDDDISDLVDDADLEPSEPATIGVDPAKQGGDKSVVAKPVTQKQK